METLQQPIIVSHQRQTLRLSASGRVTLLLGLASIGIILLQGLTSERDFDGVILMVTGVAIAGLTLLDMWLTHQFGEKPPHLSALIAVAVHALAVEMVTLIDGLTYTSILYLTLPFPVFFMLGRRAGYVASFAILIWLTAKFSIFKPDWLNDPATVNSYTLLIVSLILVTIMAQVVQSERASRHHAEELLTDLNESHQKLTAYAEQVAELATVEERNRLARDIHDSLGHYLTVIGIQLEKAAVVLRDDYDETLISIQNAKRMTDQALEDVRQSVGTLREKQPPFALHNALKQLVENFRAAPFDITLSMKGDERIFTRQQLMTLYRAAQEGLTNVQKHACAQHVTLEVFLDREAARLTLTDDGVGIQDIQKMGMGWRGLRERLELVSGRLDIESTPGQGTALHVHISRRGVNV